MSAETWFKGRFNDGVERGDRVYIESYWRRHNAEPDEPWRRLAQASFAGTVTSPPSADGGRVGNPLGEGINVTPCEPQPVDDIYASAHPTYVRPGEQAITVAGNIILIQHTIELITPDDPDGYRLVNEVPTRMTTTAEEAA